jgi:hypothetical protein
MAKFTKRIQFGLCHGRLREEAQQQKVSVNELGRTAVEKHLGELIWQRVEARQPEAKPSRQSLLDTPFSVMEPRPEGIRR